MGKFLSMTGLTTLVTKMKSYFVPQTRTVNGKALSANVTLTGSDMTVSSTDSTTVASKLSSLATDLTNGLAGKADVNEETGKIDASLLPSYVNDVLEYAGEVAAPTLQGTGATSPVSIFFDTTNKVFVAADSLLSAKYYGSWQGTDSIEESLSWGEAGTKGVSPAKGKIYVNTATNKVYRWGGSAMVEISPDVAYTLPQATASALGGIKIGYTESGKNYAVQLDANGKAYVNVPWSNTGGVADSVAWGNVTGVPTVISGITNGSTNANLLTSLFGAGRVLTKLTSSGNTITAQGYNNSSQGVSDSVELKTVNGESLIGSGDITIATEDTKVTQEASPGSGIYYVLMAGTANNTKEETGTVKKSSSLRVNTETGATYASEVQTVTLTATSTGAAIVSKGLVQATGYKTTSGTSTQALMADGSVADEITTAEITALFS